MRVSEHRPKPLSIISYGSRVSAQSARGAGYNNYTSRLRPAAAQGRLKIKKCGAGAPRKRNIKVPDQSHRGWPGSARPNPPLHAPAIQGVPSFGGIPTFVGTQIAPICYVYKLVNPVYKKRYVGSVEIAN
jgi:hypothetical protein